MRLPNYTHAVVDLTKLTDYCVDPSHPRGRHKARVFASVLGVTARHAGELRAALLHAAATSNAAVENGSDDFGRRYMPGFEYPGPHGRAWVRSAWRVRSGERGPRLTTCFVR